MGTRGLLGFIIRGERLGARNQFGSYPEFLGQKIVEFILSLNEEQMGEMVCRLEAIEWVDEDSSVPEDVHARYVYLDFHYTEFDLEYRRGNPDYFPYRPYERDALPWFKLLRGMQDGRCLPQILSGRLNHLIDNTYDRYYEYGYFIDFDNKTLTVDSVATATVAFKDLTLEWMSENSRKVWEGGYEEDETDEEDEDEVDVVGDGERSVQQDSPTEIGESEVDKEDEDHPEPDRPNTSAYPDDVQLENGSPPRHLTADPIGPDLAPTPRAQSESRKRRHSLSGDVIIERRSRLDPYLSVLGGLGMGIIPVSPGGMDELVQRTLGSATNEVGMVGDGEGVEDGPGGVQQVIGAARSTAEATKDEQPGHSIDRVASHSTTRSDISTGTKGEDTATSTEV